MLSANADAQSDLGSQVPDLKQDPLGQTGSIIGTPGKERTDGKESCGVGTSFAGNNINSAMSNNFSKTPALQGNAEVITMNVNVQH